MTVTGEGTSQKLQLLRLENISVRVACLLPLADDEETVALLGVFTAAEEFGVFAVFTVSLEEEPGVFGTEEGVWDFLGVMELLASTFPLLF